MMLVQPARWATKKTIAGASGLATTFLIAFLALQPGTANTQFEKDGIPIPFADNNTESSSLKGAITHLGKRGGIDVYDVTFKGGDDTEILQADKIYLVHIPNHPDIVNAPIDNVITTVVGNSHTVNYYGYRYSDAAATIERKDIYAVKFSDRFPGKFFASQAARDDDKNHGFLLQAFEKVAGVTFQKTDGSASAARIDKAGALYVFIINEDGGARLSPKDAGICGNHIVEGREECDDGNTNELDSCRNDCSAGTPLPFGSGGIAPGVKLNLSMLTGAALTVRLDQTGTTLLQFVATATDENVSFEKVSFVASTGSLANANHYKLWKDTNADNTADTLVGSLTSASGTLTFSGSQLLASQTSRLYEIRADAAVSQGGLSLTFASGSGSVQGKRTAINLPLAGIARNGVCGISVCQIAVRTGTPTVVTFAPPDLRRLLIDPAALPSGTLVQGATGVTLYSFDASPTNGPVTVASLSLRAATGSLSLAQNYQLSFNDHNPALPDRAPVLGTLSGTLLVFTIDPAFLLGAGSNTTFTVTADMSETLIGTLRLELVEIDAFYENEDDELVQLEGKSAQGECAEDLCEIDIVSSDNPPAITVIVHPALTIDVSSMPATTTLAVSQTGTAFLFKTSAYQSSVTLQAFAFKAMTGSVNDAVFSLWQDIDGNGTFERLAVQPTVNTSAKTITFETSPNGFAAIASGSIFKFKVLAVPVIAPTMSVLQLAFNISNDEYVQATAGGFDLAGIRTNGFCDEVTCDINVEELTATRLLLTSGGFGSPSLCGNGVLNSSEACDDGDAQSGDGCSATCTIESGFTCSGTPSVCTATPTCGNGVSEGTEQCDDGNANNTDSCDNSCHVTSSSLCGNGITNEDGADALPGTVDDEECDDGDFQNGDGCSACHIDQGYICDTDASPSQCEALCGDGVTNEEGADELPGTADDEECDDGDFQSGDGCSLCQIDQGYICDGSSPSQCDALCGDGVLNEEGADELPGTADDEECDDGDFQSGDGCSLCQIDQGFTCNGEPSICTGNPPAMTCGNNICEGTENFSDIQCGSGFSMCGNPAYCPGDCSTSVCGNGMMNGTEACDDGDTVSGDGCSATCTIESGFTCNTDLSPTQCVPNPSVCGNGTTDLGETCDDGDTDSGDGCSATCSTESGYTCSGTPSVCTQPSLCGNGVMNTGEECDDGNQIETDDCDNSCHLTIPTPGS